MHLAGRGAGRGGVSGHRLARRQRRPKGHRKGAALHDVARREHTIHEDLYRRTIGLARQKARDEQRAIADRFDERRDRRAAYRRDGDGGRARFA